MHTVDLNQVSAEDAVVALQKYASGLLGNMAMGGGIGAGVGAGGGLLAEYLSSRKRKDYLNAALGGGAMGGALGAGAGVLYNGMSGAANDPANQSIEEQRMAKSTALQQERAKLVAKGDTAGAEKITKELNTYGNNSKTPPSDWTVPAARGAVVGSVAGATGSQFIPPKKDYSDNNPAIKNMRASQAASTMTAVNNANTDATTAFKGNPANTPVDLEALKLDPKYQPDPLTPKEVHMADADYGFRDRFGVPADAKLNQPDSLAVKARAASDAANEMKPNTDKARQLDEDSLAATQHNTRIDKDLLAQAQRHTAAQEATKAFPAAQGSSAMDAQTLRSKTPWVSRPATGDRIRDAINKVVDTGSNLATRYSSRTNLPTAVGSPAFHKDVASVLTPGVAANMGKQHMADQFTAARVPVTAKQRLLRASIGGGLGAGLGFAAPTLADWATGAAFPKK